MDGSKGFPVVIDDDDDGKVEDCSTEHSVGSPEVCITSLVRFRSDKKPCLWTVHEGDLRRLEPCTWLNGTVVSYLIHEHMHPNDSTFNFDTEVFGAIEREYVSSKRNMTKTYEKMRDITWSLSYETYPVILIPQYFGTGLLGPFGPIFYGMVLYRRKLCLNFCINYCEFRLNLLILMGFANRPTPPHTKFKLFLNRSRNKHML
ncbi:hypothetical protein PHMEG_0008173 [Phytophthora megakarya]|uniref:Uncharacterized protein n=1 Tax=Phytophthora megakarya TaxID=4795 RepID=A0A225WK95_9STRA|nr:hypothetical protein PHMEG_0008173 [Phytophthora megakarya]